jgi:hypothetical protein
MKPEGCTTEERKQEFRGRTKAFAGMIIRFYVGLDKQREELRVIGKQLIRSGTSVAANYREASRSILREQGMSNGVFFAGSITILMRIRQGLSTIVQKNSIRTVLGSSVPGYWERRNVP